jgi:hypothetical protein
LMTASMSGPCNQSDTRECQPYAVVEMPDDFAGLYAVRVADDKQRAEVGLYRLTVCPQCTLYTS